MSSQPAFTGGHRSAPGPSADVTLPTQRYCRQLLRRWYGLHGEVDLYAVQWRVARFLASGEAEPDKWAAQFLWAQRHGLLPAGEILAGSMADAERTLVSCFVLPTQSTAMHDGVDGLDHASDQLLDEALRTLAMGGSIGYDFSAVAPRQSHPLLVGHIWQDPVSAMATLQDTRHLAMRRPGTEQIAILRCDHPDIEHFLHALRQGHLAHMRTAIAVTDDFMHAAARGEQITLLHGAPCDARSDAPPLLHGRPTASPWGQRDAHVLWQEILQCAHEHGGLSLLFVDRLQQENNLSYCERIDAISPFGEQPLPAYGSSPLGAIDLTRCVREPFRDGARWDLDLLRQLVPLAVRMLDNVIDLTPWPLARQGEEARSKRRIGLGVTGLADALVMQGLSYGSPQAIASGAELVACLRDLAYEASCQLAVEKGGFPLLDADAFLRAPHAASRLPMHIQQTIRRTGLRNSHLLSMAPAEVISVACADNTSAGIAPPSSLRQALYLRDDDGYLSAYELTNHALRMMHMVPPDSVAHHLLLMNRTQEIEPEEQLAILAALTPLVDGGVSLAMRTDAPLNFQRFEALCWSAWRAGLKGWHCALQASWLTQDGLR